MGKITHGEFALALLALPFLSACIGGRRSESVVGPLTAVAFLGHIERRQSEQAFEKSRSYLEKALPVGTYRTWPAGMKQFVLVKGETVV